MAFGDIQTGSSQEATTVTSHTVTLPTLKAGDYLLVLFSLDGTLSDIATTPTGWTRHTYNSFNGHNAYIFGRRSDGGEGATLTVSTSVAAISSHVSVAVEKAQYNTRSFAWGTGYDMIAEDLFPSETQIDPFVLMTWFGVWEGTAGTSSLPAVFSEGRQETLQSGNNTGTASTLVRDTTSLSEAQRTFTKPQFGSWHGSIVSLTEDTSPPPATTLTGDIDLTLEDIEIDAVGWLIDHNFIDVELDSITMELREVVRVANSLEVVLEDVDFQLNGSGVNFGDFDLSLDSVDMLLYGTTNDDTDYLSTQLEDIEFSMTGANTLTGNFEVTLDDVDLEVAQHPPEQGTACCCRSIPPRLTCPTNYFDYDYDYTCASMKNDLLRLGFTQWNVQGTDINSTYPEYRKVTDGPGTGFPGQDYPTSLLYSDPISLPRQSTSIADSRLCDIAVSTFSGPGIKSSSWTWNNSKWIVDDVAIGNTGTTVYGGSRNFVAWQTVMITPTGETEAIDRTFSVYGVLKLLCRDGVPWVRMEIGFGMSYVWSQGWPYLAPDGVWRWPANRLLIRPLWGGWPYSDTGLPGWIPEMFTNPPLGNNWDYNNSSSLGPRYEFIEDRRKWCKVGLGWAGELDQWGQQLRTIGISTFAYVESPIGSAMETEVTGWTPDPMFDTLGHAHIPIRAWLS